MKNERCLKVLFRIATETVEPHCLKSKIDFAVLSDLIRKSEEEEHFDVRVTTIATYLKYSHPAEAKEQRYAPRE